MQYCDLSSTISGIVTRAVMGVISVFTVKLILSVTMEGMSPGTVGIWGSLAPRGSVPTQFLFSGETRVSTHI